MNERILLVDDDPYITEALALTLDRRGRTTVVCSDVESAELALTRFGATHLVTDVQFSGGFGFEGLHFLGRVHEQLPDCRIVLISGMVTEPLRAKALESGASALLSKPFDLEELETALATGDEGGDDYQLVRVTPLDELLRSDLLFSAYQPIVRLENGRAVPFAYEALARVHGDWALGGPAELFDYAARRARLAELNLAAIERAFAGAAELPPESLVFMNVDPLTFGDGLVQLLQRVSARSSLPLTRVVLEVTERSAFTSHAIVDRTFGALRDLGIRFALDDHGSAYSHLSEIGRIQPSFIKISHEFGTGFEHDETKLRIIRHVVGLATDFGCEIVLEGVETSDTARAAAGLGIGLAQGFHFGRARAAAHWSHFAPASCAA
ncbi:MAG TPA: EAL domain-containing response regulator [Thermoanaerobaculia bacterium]